MTNEAKKVIEDALMSEERKDVLKRFLNCGKIELVEIVKRVIFERFIYKNGYENVPVKTIRDLGWTYSSMIETL